jgi:hypothetical protein
MVIEIGCALHLPWQGKVGGCYSEKAGQSYIQEVFQCGQKEIWVCMFDQWPAWSQVKLAGSVLEY